MTADNQKPLQNLSGGLADKSAAAEAGLKNQQSLGQKPPPSSRMAWRTVKEWMFGNEVTPIFFDSFRRSVGESWLDYISRSIIKYRKFVGATILVTIVFGILLIGYPQYLLLTMFIATWFVMVYCAEWFSRKKKMHKALITQIAGRMLQSDVLPQNLGISEKFEYVQDVKTEAQLLSIPDSLMNQSPEVNGIQFINPHYFPLEGGRTLIVGDYVDESNHIIIGSINDFWSNLKIIHTISPKILHVNPKFRKRIEKIHEDIESKKFHQRTPQEVIEIQNQWKLVLDAVQVLKERALDMDQLVGEPPFDWIYLDKVTFGNKYFNNLVVAMDKVNQKYLEELQRFESMGQDTLMADVLDMVHKAETVQSYLQLIFTSTQLILGEAEIQALKRYIRISRTGSEYIDKYISLRESQLNNAVSNAVKVATSMGRDERDIKDPLEDMR